jgi:hypothetical protein
MQRTIKHRQSLSVWSFGLLLFAASTAIAASPEHQERHFAVKGHPVVVLQNIVNGRIEVKSSKNPEVVVSSTSIADKVAIDLTSAPLLSALLRCPMRSKPIFSSPFPNRPSCNSKLKRV